MARRIIVAIDGPAGAGKSTIARRLAERLGWVLVDTGAIYRTVALVAKEGGLETEAAIAEVLPGLAIRLTDNRVLLGERDVSTAIRTPELSLHASLVSAMPEVRRGLLGLQRRIAREAAAGAVLEGRDIGTVVFPDADLKIFLTASSEVRAQRRTDELARSGRPQPYEDVLRDQIERDARDESRAVAPLKAAEDAIRIDTGGRGIDDLVNEIAGLAARALNA